MFRSGWASLCNAKIDIPYKENIDYYRLTAISLYVISVSLCKLKKALILPYFGQEIQAEDQSSYQIGAYQRNGVL